jgi:hypothetical protein
VGDGEVFLREEVDYKKHSTYYNHGLETLEQRLVFDEISKEEYFEDETLTRYLRILAYLYKASNSGRPKRAGSSIYKNIDSKGINFHIKSLILLGAVENETLNNGKKFFYWLREEGMVLGKQAFDFLEKNKDIHEEKFRIWWLYS